MTQYIKKPLVVDAEQWHEFGDHSMDDVKADKYLVRNFQIPGTKGNIVCTRCDRKYSDHGWILTPEGGDMVCPGDWIIKDQYGVYHVCQHKTFIENYDKVP